MPRGKPIDAEWLRERYPMMTDINELLDEHEEKFGWRPSKTAVYTKANKLRIRKKPIQGRHKRCERPVYWCKEPEMEAWMLKHDHGQRVDSLSDEFRERFGFGLTRNQINLFRASHGTQVRQDGTRRGGRTRVPVGTERRGKDGYVVVKVREEADVAMSKDNWMLKHVHVWEQANGRKLPKGYLVMFADKNRENFDPDNLVAVSRKLIGVMNAIGYEWHDRESLMTVVAMAKIRVARNRAEASMRRVCPCCGKKFDNLNRLEHGGSIHSTVCEECGKAGRKPPNDSGGRRRKYDHDKMRELHARGYKNEQIADMLGCSAPIVSNAINHELEKRKAKRWQRTS